MGGLSPTHILILLVFAVLLIAGVTGVVMALVRSGGKPQPVTPGWYPDQAGVTRWFDGQRWTEHTQ